MKFEIIDKDKWKRKKQYEYYLSGMPTTYSMTMNIDITNIKRQKCKLYPTMIYMITALVNKHEEFRTALDEQQNVGVYDEACPSYTVFLKESENFTYLWTEYTDDYKEFVKRYNEDVNKYGNIEKFPAKAGMPDNAISISMNPWLTFTGVELNIKNGYEYLLPIFTLGKYYKENDRILLPFSIRAHHAVCDGFHIARFVNEMQEKIDNFIV